MVKITHNIKRGGSKRRCFSCSPKQAKISGTTDRPSSNQFTLGDIYTKTVKEDGKITLKKYTAGMRTRRRKKRKKSKNTRKRKKRN